MFIYFCIMSPRSQHTDVSSSRNHPHWNQRRPCRMAETALPLGCCQKDRRMLCIWSLVHNSYLWMYLPFLGRSVQFIPNSQHHSVLLPLPKLVSSVPVQVCLCLLTSWLLAPWTRPWKLRCTKPPFWKCLHKICAAETTDERLFLSMERANYGSMDASTGTAASPVLRGVQWLPCCPYKLAQWLTHGESDCVDPCLWRTVQ